MFVRSLSGGIALLAASMVSAAPVHTPRPVANPSGNVEPVALSVQPMFSSPRPILRPWNDLGRVAAVTDDSDTVGFETWLSEFREIARAEGISDQAFLSAFIGVRYDPDIIALDRDQPEFSRPIWDYLDSAASKSRIRNGHLALERYAADLSEIERVFGVEKEVVVAIWGLESAYGNYQGDDDVIQSLATLAYDGRRRAFFEEELIAALRIIDSNEAHPRKMIGSWAGAMGHTQFMPSSFLADAVDFDGDGTRNIWADNPSDALASTAAYLARFGWTKGQPWGVEVRLPASFNYRLADREIQKSTAAWAAMGVRIMSGAPVADFGPASILLPAGRQGAAFMIFQNFGVIERYNGADAYVIGVGHLSDRLNGGPAILGDWPRDEPQLSLSQRKSLQRRLTRRGYDTKGIDGRIGPNTIRAVREFQIAYGLPPDGYPDWDLFERMK